MIHRKVLIADQSPLFCRGVRTLMAAQPGYEVVGEACSLDDLHRSVHEAQPDLLLVTRSLALEDEDWGGIQMLELNDPIDCAALVESLQRLSAAIEAAFAQAGQLKVVAPSPTRPNAVLTAREQDVLQLLASGRTVKSAAYELGLSRKTAEAHTLNIMRKLDIHNRVALIEYAQESGLASLSR